MSNTHTAHPPYEFIDDDPRYCRMTRSVTEIETIARQLADEYREPIYVLRYKGSRDYIVATAATHDDAHLTGDDKLVTLEQVVS